MVKPNSMFDIVKWCENRNAIGTHYSRLKTAGNDPSVSKKMRYSQFVHTMKHRTVYTNNIVPKSEEVMPLYYFPSGQVKPK